MSRKVFNLFTISFVFVMLFFASLVFASTTDGTVTGYAWAENAGYLNFGVATGNVHVTDTVVTGYAWNSNFGWINLAPSTSGVKNNSEGVLSGYAWGENLGWINFSGVTINSSGVFSGTATGDISGRINFSCSNCNMTTDWRPASSRVITPTPTLSGGGGGSNAGNNGPSLPLSVLINNGDDFTNKISVQLSLQARNDAKEIMISNFADFRDAKKEKFIANKNWNLENIDGQKTVYVKFYSESGVASAVFLDTIILDTVAPEITITDLKESYDIFQEVIFSGKTESNADVSLILDNSYGNFQADENGDFFITLGKLSLGQHNLEIYATDKAGNKGKVIKVSFIVRQAEQIVPQPQQPGFLSPIIEKIQQGLKPLLPILTPQKQKPVAQVPILEKIGQGLYSLLPFLPQKQNQIATKIPKAVVMVPKLAPTAFSGKWNIFPSGPVNKFVLAPLPKDVAMLAQKFPKLEKTFQDVGVAKITDVEKIKNSNLSLPSLNETLGLSKIEIAPGKFMPAPGIPVAKLTPEAKAKIPSEIIFAKSAGGLVDYKIALSLNNKGQTQQQIKTIVGSPIQLVFKADGNVKKVRGYIIFKSKKPQQVSVNIPLDALATSSMFSAPNFTAALIPTQKIPLEGSKVADPETVVNTAEKRLVVGEFEYQDTGNGVYTASVQAPVVDGEYEFITVVEYESDGLLKPVSKETKLITVVDPEGYVYEKNGDKETRIVGAVVSLYQLNQATKQYELWPAGDYQQENPQVTNVSGAYSFLVPEGNYYLKVDAPGYISYDGKPFQVTEGSGVHINIELKTKYWWLNIIDWKTALLIIVLLMLVYNFYRDRKRDQWQKNLKS